MKRWLSKLLAKYRKRLRRKPGADYEGAYNQLLKTCTEVLSVIRIIPLTLGSANVHVCIEKAASDSRNVFSTYGTGSRRSYKKAYESLSGELVEIVKYAERKDEMRLYRMLAVSVIFSEMYLELSCKNLTQARNNLAGFIDGQTYTWKM